MSKKTKQKCCYIPERRGKVGGQAVLEGVMMKSGERVALTVRKDDGTKETKISNFVSIRKKYKICNLPIVRGVVNFVEMMKLSLSTLNDSADMLGIDEEMQETKFEKWLKKHFGKSVMDFIMLIAMVLGIALAIGLFIMLPTFIYGWIEKAVPFLPFENAALNSLCKSFFEGIFKIAILVGYMALVTLMKDIRRTFQYHGAEHKTIFCYESGLELTVENVRLQRRFHPRCGTSFLVLMLLVGMFVSFFIDPLFMLAGLYEGAGYLALRALVKLLLLPLIMGVGYELIKFAGRHDNAFTRAISKPGMLFQLITTNEPDDSQIEVAIAALKAVIPENKEEDKW